MLLTVLVSPPPDHLLATTYGSPSVGSGGGAPPLLACRPCVVTVIAHRISASQLRFASGPLWVSPAATRPALIKSRIFRFYEYVYDYTLSFYLLRYLAHQFYTETTHHFLLVHENFTTQTSMRQGASSTSLSRGRGSPEASGVHNTAGYGCGFFLGRG